MHCESTQDQGTVHIRGTKELPLLTLCGKELFLPISWEGQSQLFPGQVCENQGLRVELTYRLRTRLSFQPRVECSSVPVPRPMANCVLFVSSIQHRPTLRRCHATLDICAYALLVCRLLALIRIGVCLCHCLNQSGHMVAQGTSRSHTHHVPKATDNVLGGTGTGMPFRLVDCSLDPTGVKF